MGSLPQLKSTLQSLMNETNTNWTAQQWWNWLNETVTSAKKRPIPAGELFAWSAADSRYKKIEDIALNRDHPLYSVCKVALGMMSDRDFILDLNLPDRALLFGALVQNNVLSANDSAALQALAVLTQPRYIDLGLEEFHIGDIEAALE